MKKQLDILIKLTRVIGRTTNVKFLFSTKPNKVVSKQVNIEQTVNIKNLNNEQGNNVKLVVKPSSEHSFKDDDYFDTNLNPIRNIQLDKERKIRIDERLEQFKRDNNYRDKLFYLKYQWSKIQRDKIQYNLTRISQNLNIYQQQECDSLIKIISKFKIQDYILFQEEVMKHRAIANNKMKHIPTFFDPNFAIYQQLFLNLLPFIVSGHFLGGIVKNDENLNKNKEDNIVNNANTDNNKAKEIEKKIEKTHFDIKLVSFDPTKKIALIKEVKTIFNLGLKESKEAVEKTDDFLKKAVKMEEANEIKQKLEAFGAKIELL